jgi:thiopeptide-type bacteriocin biosynthesis protein
MAARYRHHGLVLVRSTTDPGDLRVPRDLDLADPHGVGGQGRAWLAETWARRDVREAVTAASPDLAAQLSRLLASPEQADVRDLRRAVASLACYLLRWQRRVTPFGLFAGVVPAATGPAAAVMGSAHRAVARPDAEWTQAVARDLSRCPALLGRLAVVADATAVVRGGRLVLARRAGPGDRDPGPASEASVRWTRPVRAAMELAGFPVRFDALAAGLAARFPATSGQGVWSLLDGLAAEGFLITSLHPPMTSDDPLGYLRAALRSAGADQVPGAAPVLRELDAVSGLIAQHNACPGPGDAAALRADAGARMAAIASGGASPLAVDVRLDAHVTVPGPVLAEAAAAADVLLRVTTRPFGAMAWMEYQARFKERYGPGALVPVRDLVADSGLGYPDGYLGAAPARPVWRMVTERDARLLALIQRAALDGSDEIRLTRDDITALTVGDHADVVPPHRGEIAVALHAASAEAVTAGQFELRVTGVARFPGSMAGRFSHLLTAGERETAAAASGAGEAGGDVVAVQVSFPPRVPRNEHMTRAAALAGAVLSVGEHPDPGGAETVSVDDLSVTADAAQMYLVHVPTGRRVVPHVAHALEMTVHTPPLARFVAEVAAARCAELRPLDLGAARVLPWVPRIRYRKTILSPARWHLDSTAFGAGPGAGWDERLDAWRRAWRVPVRVVLCHGGQRLPLDLDSLLDRQLLRLHMDRSSRAELREDGPAGSDGWLGRPAELLIPLTLACPSARPLPPTAAPGTVHRPGTGTIVCAQVTGNPARFDDIIGCHLPALAARLDGVAVRWWVRRYRDMIHSEVPQHVAVYLRLASPAAFGRAAAELAGLGEELEADGLPCTVSLASCYDHPGRHGDGEALSAVEEVFAADTAAAAAQLAMAADSGVPGQALAAASMARIAAAFAPNPGTGYRALTACLAQGSGPIDRAVRDLTCDLADPDGGPAALRALPGGARTAETWARRDAALAGYHAALSAQRDPGTVLRTLLHEHHMRAVGLDPEYEKQTGRLARAAALRQLARTGRL